MFVKPPRVPSGLPGEPLDCNNWLEATAQQFADIADGDACESLLTCLTEQAISAWRLNDATLWQRVKYRVRMIRAQRGDQPAPEAEHGADRRR